MKFSYYYVVILGMITLLGASTEFSNLIFAEVDDVPDEPEDLEAEAVSSTEIKLSWDEPRDDTDDNNTEITGYKLEYRESSASDFGCNSC